MIRINIGDSFVVATDKVCGHDFELSTLEHYRYLGGLEPPIKEVA
jgi:hypothetical protein